MGLKSTYFLCLALLLAFSSSSQAFDVTKLLANSSDLGLFSQYLTETKLADEINKQKAVTIFTVANKTLSAISNKPLPTIKAIISTHVVIGYYDMKLLMEAAQTGQPMTTLYQNTGKAVGKQGYVKVQLVGEGSFGFSSAEPGAPVDAELVDMIAKEPNSIFIFQVTKPIMFPGVDQASGAGADVKAAATPEQASAPDSDRVLAPAPGPSSSSSRTEIVGLVGAIMGLVSLLVVL